MEKLKKKNKINYKNKHLKKKLKKKINLKKIKKQRK